MIVVTGATGNIGRSLVEQLVAQGVPVRALTRDPARAGLPEAAEVVRADLSAGQPLEPLLDGANGLFLNLAATRGADVADIVAAAVAAGVQRIVLNSSMAVTGVPEDDTAPIAVWHAEAERLIRESGLEWCFVRGGMYATNALMWADGIRTDGLVRGPFPGTTAAPVHEADLAEIALRAFLDEDGTHTGQVYVVTGPEGITFEGQAAAIGRALGRPEVRFERVSFEEGIALMERHGAPGPVAEDVLRNFEATVGTEARVTDAVLRVTGHPARSFEEWARDHVADFR
ncbi:NAD(P)H-binding protein [Streptomyces albireticuli]|uniref:NAD(P)H-binding protein n=1 Tax=Streptomyces albireticuli TaxID=1940 RepID=UPI000B455074|nr:NAD(P)H-binding protein [Streptomyces albireticuli]